MPDIFSSSDQTHSENSPESLAETSLPSGGGVVAETKAAKVATKTVATSEKKIHRSVDDYSEIMKNEVACSDPLAAYSPKPKHVSFSTQATTETVLLMLRQHPVTQVPWILTILFLAFVPFVFYFSPSSAFFPANYLVAFMIFWYLFLTGMSLEQFLKWFYNVYIITDERIIDVDFVSLIYKNVSAAKIDNIEDVTATSGGFFAALFDYGRVTVQTAAEKREFEFDGIPHPNKVVALINELILEEEKEKIDGRVS